MIKHDDLLSTYNAIWDKISTDAKIDLNSKPVYKNVYGDKARDFHNKEVPKVDSSCTCFAFISLDSIFEVNENYFPRVLLRERRYIEKK